MLKFILNQWKQKKITIVLIVMGFFVGSLVLSIGVSVSIENINYLYDQNSGLPENQLELTIKKSNEAEKENIINLIQECSQYGEVQILNLGDVTLNDYNKKYQVVPVKFEKKSSWNIPLINGEYFRVGHQTEKEIIIGKDIADENNIEVNQQVILNNEQYKVIGITGRRTRSTQWDRVIYTNMDAFIINNMDYITSDQEYYLLLKNGKEAFMSVSEEMISNAMNDKVELSFSSLDSTVDFSSVSNSVIITVVSSVIILGIAMINVVNLMIYWVLERRREFGIMKALGATDRYLIKWTLLEITFMSFISAVLAIMVQGLATRVFMNLMAERQVSIDITFYNLGISIAVTVLCGIISAIIPMKKTAKIEPVEVINNG